MIMFFIIEHVYPTGYQLFGKFTYSFDCTFFRLICLQGVGKKREQERKLCLTAKTLRRVVASDSCPLATYTPSMEITMCGFLVGATEPEKRTLKRVQLWTSGLYLGRR